MMNRLFLTAICTFFLLGTSVAWAQNCCLPKMEEGGDLYVGRLISGIQIGTALLILVPYVLIGSLGYWFYRKWKADAVAESVEQAD